MRRSLLIFIILCFSQATYAKAIMVITPVTSGAITLGQMQTITIDYTVMNNTNRHDLWNFSIYPRFNVDPKASCAISLKTNNCTTTLAPGASCTFQIQLQGNVHLPSSFTLSPRVCAYTIGSSAAVCSQPISTDRSIVNVVPNLVGCSANVYGTACYVMVSKNKMQGDMTVLSPAALDAPDVSACNTFSGVSKADCICGIEGPAANSGNGTWKAWLGLTTGGNNNPRQRLDNLLGHPAYPLTSSWVSLQSGLPVYVNWGALPSNDINGYPAVSNVISSSSTVVRTGGSNNLITGSASALTCNNWTTSASTVDVGRPNGTVATTYAPNSWNANGIEPTCTSYRAIYCTEVSP
jgi:hypothetical protein